MSGPNRVNNRQHHPEYQSADGERCAGQSAAWNRQGHCVAQLDDSQEELLIFDTEREEVLLMAV
ncbi:MAG: hypothetical protein DHS20C20_00430 [Ardenticatenaceae bacterium]|nr:MAG: hypothetical protein DHS20C20_00430 [Ardenticatenaceae bacterium]